MAEVGPHSMKTLLSLAETGSIPDAIIRAGNTHAVPEAPRDERRGRVDATSEDQTGGRRPVTINTEKNASRSLCPDV